MTVKEKNPNAAMKHSSAVEIIPIIKQDERLLVDARLLHRRLQIDTKFSTWIQRRIEEYGFVENEDYLLPKFGKQVPHQGGLRTQTLNEYHLTLHTAIELAMVERNEIGRHVRKYFIEAEKNSRTMILGAEKEGKFAGLVPMLIEGKKVFSYMEVLRRVGFSTKSGAVQKRKYKYSGQFIKVFGRNFITTSLAETLVLEKQLFDKQKSMQLSINFDDIMSDVCLIDDKELRTRIAAKLKGGFSHV